jgi:gamma-glutamylcyclotransferase (GGCT)/AIG2-like uncharacterized protein YtfP
MADGSARAPGGDADHVFVYGTLKPGHLRWPLLEPFVVAHRPATVAGRLYDTGVGYPAARFDELGTIEGVVCGLEPTAASAAWALLDGVEGAQYRRVLVAAVLDGDPGDPGVGGDLGVEGGGGASPAVVVAGSYEFVAGHAGMTDLDGRWDGL